MRANPKRSLGAMKCFSNPINSFPHIEKQGNLIIRQLEKRWAWIRRPTHGMTTGKPFHQNLPEICITMALT